MGYLGSRGGRQGQKKRLEGGGGKSSKLPPARFPKNVIRDRERKRWFNRVKKLKYVKLQGFRKVGFMVYYSLGVPHMHWNCFWREHGNSLKRKKVYTVPKAFCDLAFFLEI